MTGYLTTYSFRGGHQVQNSDPRTLSYSWLRLVAILLMRRERVSQGQWKDETVEMSPDVMMFVTAESMKVVP